MMWSIIKVTEAARRRYADQRALRTVTETRPVEKVTALARLRYDRRLAIANHCQRRTRGLKKWLATHQGTGRINYRWP